MTSTIREVRVIRRDVRELEGLVSIGTGELFRACYGDPAVFS